MGLAETGDPLGRGGERDAVTGLTRADAEPGGQVRLAGSGWPIYTQTFRRAVRRLGLPYIRLHDLRHTHATIGLDAGVPVKVMSDRLGHATTAFTQDVDMHSVASLEDSAAGQIADLIFGEASADEDNALGE